MTIEIDGVYAKGICSLHGAAGKSAARRLSRQLNRPVIFAYDRTTIVSIDPSGCWCKLDLSKVENDTGVTLFTPSKPLVYLGGAWMDYPKACAVLETLLKRGEGILAAARAGNPGTK